MQRVIALIEDGKGLDRLTGREKMRLSTGLRLRLGFCRCESAEQSRDARCGCNSYTANDGKCPGSGLDRPRPAGRGRRDKAHADTLQMTNPHDLCRIRTGRPWTNHCSSNFHHVSQFLFDGFAARLKYQSARLIN